MLEIMVVRRCIISIQILLSMMAQLGGCPTGDQEVVGSTSSGSATFFHGDLIMKYFQRSFSPF